MDDVTKQAIVAELSETINKSIAENISAIAGEDVAQRVKSIVEKMQFDRVTTGSDASGLTDSVKEAFAKDIAAIGKGQFTVEKAAILSSSDEAGGYLIPSELYSGILRVAASAGIIARDAMRMTMGQTIDIPRYTGADLEGAYQGEDTEGSESSLTFADLKLTAKTWIVVLRMSNTMLKHATVNLSDWLIGLVAEGLSVKLDKEGFNGTVNIGLLKSEDVTVYTMPTGKDTFAEFDMDDASDVIGAMPESLLAGAAFYFNRTVWAKIRTKKDSAGAYVVGANGAIVADYFKKEGIQPAGSLWGFPVFTTDQLPTNAQTAVSKKFAVFANLSKALVLGETGTMTVLKSEHATVGGKSTFLANQQAIRFTHDHAIGVMLPTAAIVIKTAAS